MGGEYAQVKRINAATELFQDLLLESGRVSLLHQNEVFLGRNDVIDLLRSQQTTANERAANGQYVS